tara:strand:+ start:1684 stop:1878 length:195 start_codon:yes stop_codon:yes gene_type:complete
MNANNEAPYAGAPASEHPTASLAGGLRELKSEELLRGATEILIRHGRDHYRLRTTSKGKLILTK